MVRLAVLLCVALVVLASCSGSGPTIDEYAPVLQERAVAYADEVETLAEQHAADLNSAVNRLQNDLTGDALLEAAVAETAARSSMLFAGIGDAIDRYVRELDAMAVPGAVEDAHVSYVAALDASLSGVAPLLEALAAASTFDQIDQAIASSGFSDAQSRVEAACAALQAVVESAGATVDLRCVVVR